MSFNDGMIWVGQSYYRILCPGNSCAEPGSKKKRKCYVHEANWRGCCRKVPDEPKWIVPGKSKIFLVHRDNVKSKNRGKIFGYFVVKRIEKLQIPEKIAPLQIKKTVALKAGKLEELIKENVNPTLEGFVYRTDNGDPIKGAEVRFQPEGEKENMAEKTTSGDDGHYKLELLPGSYDAYVNAVCYDEETLEGVEISYEEKTTQDFYLTPQKCGEKLELKMECWNGDKIVTHRFEGGEWVETGNKCPDPPKKPPKCNDGDVRTQECWDGTRVVTYRCKNGKWVKTKDKCPSPPKEPVKCKDGEVKEKECWDGTKIVTHQCKDGKWVGKFDNCPEKPECEDGTVKEKECPDGSIIVTHICKDGRWVKTYEKCPREPDDDDDYDDDDDDYNGNNGNGPVEVPIDYTVFEYHRWCSLRLRPKGIYLVDSLTAEITDSFNKKLYDSGIWEKYKNARNDRKRKEIIKKGNELFAKVVKEIHAHRKQTTIVPKPLEKKVDVYGELIYFKDPPILENQPQAAFRGLRRINGHHLIRQIIKGVRIPEMKYYEDESTTPRKRLINKISKKHKINEAKSERILKEITGFIQQELRKNGRFSLTGFGSFSVAHRKARIGRNPKTGGKINVPAKDVVKFKPGKNLKDTIHPQKAPKKTK